MPLAAPMWKSVQMSVKVYFRFFTLKGVCWNYFEVLSITFYQVNCLSLSSAIVSGLSVVSCKGLELRGLSLQETVQDGESVMPFLIRH